MNIGRLVINGVDIDLGEAIPVPLGYSLADIKNPENRKRNTSKVIKLPGTRANRDFFFSTYNLSISAVEPSSIAGFEFDPTQRVTAQYYKRGRKVFDGLAQLMYVTKKGEDYTFNITLFSNFVDLFMALGNMTLAELGWSEYSHALTIANIQASWDTSVIKNGVATSNFTAGVPNGFGYLYPYVDYGYAANVRDIFTNDLAPHVYWREVMQKCLDLAGITWSSNFLDSELFKRLVIGFGGGPKQTLSPTEVAARRVNYTGTLSYSTTISHLTSNYVYPTGFGSGGYYSYYFNHFKRLRLGDTTWATTTMVSDTYTQFDETTQELTILKKGSYELDLTLVFDIDRSINGSTIAGGNLQNVNTNFMVYKNGSIINATVNTIGTGTKTLSRTMSLSCEAGDVIYFEVFLQQVGTLHSTDEPANAPTIDLSIDNNGALSFNLVSSNGTLLQGDTVDVAAFLPNIKASEFIKGVITSFNLYIDDPDTEGVVKIEPLENFYLGSNFADDWSLKVDHSKEQIIAPSSMIEGKTYAFRFAEDSDYYNQLYRDIEGTGYGDMIYTVPSTFQQGERTYSVPWAQTVPVEVPGTDIIIPTIISVDAATGAVSPFKGKARVYYYQGLRTVTDSWTLRSAGFPATYTTLNKYPCVSHLDDYAAPTFDLNFGPPAIVWWTIVAYTLENLFTYHEKFLREITGKDSKILTAYMLLDEDDIQPQSFRRPAMINGVLFRKNTVEDFNGNGDEPCKVELIRIVEGNRRPLFYLTLTSATISQPFTADGGTDTNGTDTVPVLVSGGKDSVEVRSNIKYGG